MTSIAFVSILDYKTFFDTFTNSFNNLSFDSGDDFGKLLCTLQRDYAYRLKSNQKYMDYQAEIIPEIFSDKITDKDREYFRNLDYSKDENLLKLQMLDVDKDKADLVSEIAYMTGAQVVITSSWKSLRIFPLVVRELLRYGIPVIGSTPNMENRRGEEIRTYLKEHPEVKKYAILDDEIFGDYDELMDHLVKTNFFNNGLESYHVNQIVNLLGKKEDDQK